MIVEVQFPIDPSSGKGFLLSGYLRRNAETVEFGVAKQDGHDYAWSTMSDEQFKDAVARLFPEINFNAR